MKFDPNKLTLLNIQGGYEIVFKNLPIKRAIKEVVEKNIAEFTLDDPKDNSLHGQTIKCLLDRDVAPPLIYIHIDGHYAGRYFYNDKEFAQRASFKPSF